MAVARNVVPNQAAHQPVQNQQAERRLNTILAVVTTCAAVIAVMTTLFSREQIGCPTSALVTGFPWENGQCGSFVSSKFTVPHDEVKDSGNEINQQRSLDYPNGVSFLINDKANKCGAPNAIASSGTYSGSVSKKGNWVKGIYTTNKADCKGGSMVEYDGTWKVVKPTRFTQGQRIGTAPMFLHGKITTTALDGKTREITHLNEDGTKKIHSEALQNNGRWLPTS